MDQDEQRQEPFFMDRGVKEFQDGSYIEIFEHFGYSPDLGHFNADEDVTRAVLSRAGLEKCPEDLGFGRACAGTELFLSVSVVHKFNKFNVVYG